MPVGFVSQVLDSAAAAASGATTAFTANQHSFGTTLLALVRTLSGATTTGMTDSKSNTWTNDVSTAGSSVNLALYRLTPTTPFTTSDTVTVNATAGTYRIWIYEYAGFYPSPLDKTSSATGLAVTTLATGSTGTLTYPNELALTAQFNGGGVTTTAPSGYIERLSVTVTTKQIDAADQHVVSTAALNPTWTYSAGVDAAVLIATYQMREGTLLKGLSRPRPFAPGIAR